MTQLASAQIAPVSRRAIAYLIDAFIAAGLAIVLIGGLVVAATLAGPNGMLNTLLIGAPIVSLLLLAWFVVYTFMQAGGGSIGMRAQRLRLVTATEQAQLGFGRALLRNIIFALACAIVVGYFTPLFDGSGRFQGWHDKVAGSLMLDSRGTGPAPVGSAATPAATQPVEPALPVEQARPTAPGLPVIPHPTTQPAAPSAVPIAVPTAVSAPGDDGSLIAFVPGVSQESSPPRVMAAPAPQQDSESDLDVTVLGRPDRRTGAPSAAAAPAPAVSGIDSGAVETVVPVPEDTRISIPGHRLVFTWDDGTRVSVSRRTIFGRNPAAEDGAVVVSVRDETLSLSKTHFEAAAESSGGWVLDRHSTNGTTLVREGQRIACPAGQRVPVRLGDAIEIGDRIVTIGGYE